MPPESAVDQALLLKKRARRRLVGAIALVIIMLIILPNVLKDQSNLQERAPIKLSMPENIQNDVASNNEHQSPAENLESVIPTAALPETIHTENSPPEPDKINEANKNTNLVAATPKPLQEVQKEVVTEQTKKNNDEKVRLNDPKQKENLNKIAQNVDKNLNNELPAKLSESNPNIDKTPSKKLNEAKSQKFLIQIGVYSDEANVKQLQSKIAAAGFSSRTAKLQTAKGEKIRLRVGSFVTREAAAEALKKIQASGLSGMVLIDE